MLDHVARYFIVLIVLVGGDAVWLSYFARAVFRPTLGGILLDDPRWWAAALFYPLFALGVVVFALSSGRRKTSWRNSIFYGALFGFIAYATYDLTNLATLKAWTPALAIVDIVWGTLLSGAAALGAHAGWRRA